MFLDKRFVLFTDYLSKLRISIPYCDKGKNKFKLISLLPSLLYGTVDSINPKSGRTLRHCLFASEYYCTLLELLQLVRTPIQDARNDTCKSSTHRTICATTIQFFHYGIILYVLRTRPSPSTSVYMCFYYTLRQTLHRL